MGARVLLGLVVVLVLPIQPLSADCDGGEVFGETIVAPDRDTLAWSTPTDVDYLQGSLDRVSTYASVLRASADTVNFVDISGDHPQPGKGFFYLVKTSSPPCGSWQTTTDNEPLRDGTIHPPCSEVAPTSTEIETAVQDALTTVNDPWGNVSDFVLLLERVQDDIGCTLDVDLSGLAGESAAGSPCELEFCEGVRYCGPGNSLSGLGVFAGPCLNEACYEHDRCYLSSCVQPECVFSLQSEFVVCDQPFFEQFPTCAATDGTFFAFDSVVTSLATLLAARTSPCAAAPPCAGPPGCAGSSCVCDSTTGECEQAGEWTQATPSQSPRSRSTHAMAYDSTRGMTVLYGGFSSGSRLYDTWEWDGDEWTQHPVGGTEWPGPRSAHRMVYDSAREVTVLFGGREDEYLSDTWEWHGRKVGSEWVQRDVTGPPPRAYQAMAYDSARGVTVLFGGNDGTMPWLSDTWEWDGDRWTQRNVTGPTPGSVIGTPQMVYDSARGVCVLFFYDDNYDSETWEFDGNAWTQRSVGSGPPGLFQPAMAHDSAHGVTVLFGGASLPGYVFSSDTWEWDGVAWRLTASAAPAGRAGHAMAYDSIRDRTVLFGGGATADTWLYRSSEP